MTKVNFIARYGEASYEKLLAQQREYNKTHKGEAKEYNRKYREEHREDLMAADKIYYEEHREEIKETGKEYREEHLEEVKARNQEISRKGGKHYERHLEYQTTGIPGEKNKIRKRHVYKYKPYKAIIAPESQIHHEWLNDGTAAYSGVALVEKDQHMHGFVDVIEILDGEIKLLTEEQIRKGGV